MEGEHGEKGVFFLLDLFSGVWMAREAEQEGGEGLITWVKFGRFDMIWPFDRLNMNIISPGWNWN